MRGFVTSDVIAPMFNPQDDHFDPARPSMSYTLPSRLLRAALAANAVAGGTIALLLFLAPHVAARSFGLPVELVLTGCVLLGAYTAALIRLVSSATAARVIVILALLGNLLWAAGCLALLAALRSELTPSGNAVLLVQAIGAVACTVAQALGLRRSRTVSQSSASFGWRGTL